MSSEFNLEEIEKTFAKYERGKLFSGVVVDRREDGAIFNVGGKRDAFLPRQEIDDFEELKIGDRFLVAIVKNKNEEGMIEVSKIEADRQILGSQTAQKLKLGSRFTFVPTFVEDGLVSKMGDYKIFVPKDEVSEGRVDLKKMLAKQAEAIVTEINREEKQIIASIKLLQNQIEQTKSDLFWKSIFINKIVLGTVKKFMPYGAFVEVEGVDCFLHISDMSFKRIEHPSEVLSEGETRHFKVIELDRENKKVKLGLKQILKDPLIEKIEKLNEGDQFRGEVVKILPFGAIVKLENELSGLLHISSVTERKNANIYEFVKLGDKVEVEIIGVIPDQKKIALKLIKKTD